jgi:putative flippase GtrA
VQLKKSIFRIYREIFLKYADLYTPGFLAYAATAAVCASVEWSVFATSLLFTSPLFAAFNGFFLATALNFVLSRRFVFISERPLVEELALVTGVSGLAFIANLAAFFVLKDMLLIGLMPAKVAGTFVGFAANYVTRQFYVYSRKSRFMAISITIPARLRRYGYRD